MYSRTDPWITIWRSLLCSYNHKIYIYNGADHRLETAGNGLERAREVDQADLYSYQAGRRKEEGSVSVCERAAAGGRVEGSSTRSRSQEWDPSCC